jgi:tellurite resistance protein
MVKAQSARTLLAAALAALVLGSCATGRVDPEPQRRANQRLQETEQRRALSGGMNWL